MPPLTTGSPYLLLGVAGAVFILVGSLLSALVPMQLALMIGQLVGLLGGALVFRRAFEPPDGGWPGWRGERPGWWIALGCVGAGALGVAINALASLTAKLDPSLAARAADYTTRSVALLHPEQAWLMVIAHISVTVTAPLTEEALFRGAILPAQRLKLGVGASCALNGLLFAAFHFQLLVLLPLTLLGAYLAWLTLTSRSLLAPILAHATVNAASALMMAAQRASAQPPRPVEELPAVELLAMMGAGGLVFALVAATLARRPL